jgi:hypothetical protein
MPAPLLALTLALAMDISLMLSRSTTTKNGHRPNLGSMGAARPDAPAVTHTFIRASLKYIFINRQSGTFCLCCSSPTIAQDNDMIIALICDFVFKEFA